MTFFFWSQNFRKWPLEVTAHEELVQILGLGKPLGSLGNNQSESKVPRLQGDLHKWLNALWKFHEDPTCFGCFREDLNLVWYGMVWYGLVWFETTSIWRFCESFIKIRLVLAVLEMIYSWFGMVWYGLVWYDLVWSDLRQHPSEASVKVSSRSALF